MKQINKYLRLALLSVFVCLFSLTASAFETTADYMYTNDALYDQLFSPSAENGLATPIFGQDMISGDYLAETDGGLFFEETSDINYLEGEGPGGPDDLGVGQRDDGSPVGDIAIPFVFCLILGYGFYLFRKERAKKEVQE